MSTVMCSRSGPAGKNARRARIAGIFQLLRSSDRLCAARQVRVDYELPPLVTSIAGHKVSPRMLVQCTVEIWSIVFKLVSPYPQVGCYLPPIAAPFHHKSAQSRGLGSEPDPELN